MAERAHEVDAAIFDAYVDLGEGHPQAAQQCFARVLELDARNAEASVGLVLAMLRLDRHAEALALLRDAPHTPAFERLRALAAQQPPPAESPDWLLHATSFELFVDGESLRVESEHRPPSERAEWMRQALARFDEAVVRAPQARALYHELRALTASEAGDERATRSACAALESLWPDSARVLYRAGSALSSIDPRAALALLERSIQLDGTYAASFQCLGTAHFRLGEYDAAADAYARALALDPRDVPAYNGLACALRQEGCVDDARALLLTALSLDPNAIEPWGNLAMVAQDPENIASAAEHVLELDSGQTAYRAIYGEALENMGDFPGARDQYGIAVSQSPGFARCWVAYARALIESGDARTALDAALIARSLDPRAADLDVVEDGARAALADE
jgi:tetratricopeptide (TPR) repeat protein